MAEGAFQRIPDDPSGGNPPKVGEITASHDLLGIHPQSLQPPLGLTRFGTLPRWQNRITEVFYGSPDSSPDVTSIREPVLPEKAGWFERQCFAIRERWERWQREKGGEEEGLTSSCWESDWVRDPTAQGAPWHLSPERGLPEYDTVRYPFKAAEVILGGKGKPQKLEIIDVVLRRIGEQHDRNADMALVVLAEQGSFSYGVLWGQYFERLEDEALPKDEPPLPRRWTAHMNPKQWQHLVRVTDGLLDEELRKPITSAWQRFLLPFSPPSPS